MPGYPLVRFLIACTLLLGLLPGLVSRSADAQIAGVELDIQAEHLGLGGYIRRGSWTPVRLELYNQGAEPINVVCRWILRDDDKDKVVAEREATLGAQRDERVWLYANPPLDSSPMDAWTFQVVEADSNRLLDQQEVQIPSAAFLSPSTNMVGVCGFASLGLRPWDRWSVQHEPLQRVEGLSLTTLPDRWYGLASLSALVWSPEEGGDPDDIKFTEPMRAALREWVYRGGHLVVVMPAAGQTWTSSGVSDLLAPLGNSDIRQIEASPPMQAFGILESTEPIPMLAFDLEAAEGYTELISLAVPGEDPGDPNEQAAVIVERRFGFGQVTLIGVDLTSAAALKVIDGFQMHTVWTHVFGWRASNTGRLIPPDQLDSQDGKRLYRDPKAFTTEHPELGDWVGTRVARQASTGITLGLAILLFLLYGGVTLLTFPAVLRSKGWDRHSWLVFVVIVGLFSAVAWGGASLLRPAKTSATHFSVLTIDGNRNLVHTRSWISLYVPQFDRVEVAVPSEADGVLSQELHNVLSSPGMSLSAEDPGYPDTQTYAYDAGKPDRIVYPIRATTKPLVADFLGQITGSREGLDEPWSLPSASVSVSGNGLPSGTLQHSFDGPLTDVLIIYCPGGTGQINDESWRPWVWEYRNANNQRVWAPGETMTLPGNTQNATRLWLRPPIGSNRDYKKEGYLGNAVNSRGGGESGGSETSVVRDMTLLSFFDALPPPKYQNEGNLSAMATRHWTYHRALMREADLTQMIHGRRLIIIGHLRDSPAPLPLSVEGEAVPTEGWTVVRWIYDF